MRGLKHNRVYLNLCAPKCGLTGLIISKTAFNECLRVREYLFENYTAGPKIKCEIIVTEFLLLNRQQCAYFLMYDMVSSFAWLVILMSLNVLSTTSIIRDAYRIGNRTLHPVPLHPDRQANSAHHFCPSND